MISWLGLSLRCFSEFVIPSSLELSSLACLACIQVEFGAVRGGKWRFTVTSLAKTTGKSFLFLFYLAQHALNGLGDRAQNGRLKPTCLSLKDWSYGIEQAFKNDYRWITIKANMEINT